MAVIEIRSLAQVINYLKRDSLLLVDIDDTLIRATGPKYECPNAIFRKLMSDFPARYTKDKKFMSYFNQNYLDIVKQFNQAVLEANWTDIEFSSSHFNKWKDRCDSVVGITARGRELAKVTEQTLRQNHIYFEKHNSLIYDQNADPLANGRTGLSPTRNILYCGGHDKGDVLFNYLAFGFLSCHPGIVMVDDSMTGLKQVEKVCNDFSIPFIGLHYVNEP